MNEQLQLGRRDGTANVWMWVKTLKRMRASQAVKHSGLIGGNTPSCGRAYQ